MSQTIVRQSIAQFITAHSLSMSVTRAASNPAMAESSGMDHWRCHLRCGRRSMSIVFSMGPGHHGAEPKLPDVLDCIASDSAGIENARDFADWASEYGYDTDSRKAERIFKTCQRQTAAIRKLLGSQEVLESLLWHTERG